MIERRKHERKPHAVSMEQSANANAWERFSKNPDRWKMVQDFPKQFEPKKGRKL